MDNKKKLFILGAGASIPYGYPSGLNLIKDIIHHIDKDKILYPIPLQPHKYTLEDFAAKLNNFFGGIEGIELVELERNGKILKTIKAKNSTSPLNSAVISLYEIEELTSLKEALTQFAPVSIDEFIRDNPLYAFAGKCMIVYTLLARENPDHFHLNYTPPTTKKDEVNGVNNEHDNWYPYLLSDILSGCADNPKKIMNSGMSFITFNYDISLDFYLQSRLNEIQILKDLNDNSYLEEYKVHHVYGSIYGDEKPQYGKFKYTEPKDLFNNFLRLTKSCNLYENIQTMYKERSQENNYNYLDTYEKHNEIIFIGFGFNSDNLKKICFPSTIHGSNGYNEMFAEKTIRYLNYAGKMTALDKEFEIIADYCRRQIRTASKPIDGKGLVIIRSHAISITDAYFRDFKTSLLS